MARLLHLGRITCDKITGQVIELDVSCSQLEGTIDSDSGLFRLPHFRRLNLAYNGINSSNISNFFGKFTHLTSLNLSVNRFTGQVPSEILMLTELTSLDLSYTKFTLAPNIFKLLLTNFTKLSQVSLSSLFILSSIPKNQSASLETIDISYNNLQGKVPETIFHLPNMKKLILFENPQLDGLLPTVRWNSSTSLEWLDLSKTSFSGEIPESIGKLSILKHIDLSSCGFNGSLPKGIFINMTQIEIIDFSHNKLIGFIPSLSGEAKHLKKLILANNSFTGTIISSGLFLLQSLELLNLGLNQLYGHVPIELSSLVNLGCLALSSNNFSGLVPIELSRLVNLMCLELSSNNFSGYLDVGIFSNMKQLNTLTLSHNRLSLVNKNNSILPESVMVLELASCNITKLDFLRSRPALRRFILRIDLSLNNIKEVPSSLWSNSSNIFFLNISYNAITHIEGIHIQQLYVLDIRSNLIQGPFPEVPDSIQFLLISDNQFFGAIPPSLLCRLGSLEILDLSNNNFTGVLPHCVGNMSEVLQVLDMHMNKFEGTIPNNFSSSHLATLNLHGNHLRGKIPSSLAKCMTLKVLDLGNNNLNDTFPSWLGALPELRVLSLRSNNFHGKIGFPLAPNSFLNLQILDLFNNQFVGTIPPMIFESFIGMMKIDETNKHASYIGNVSFYNDFTVLVNKGSQVELAKILTTWTTIDLSSNCFEGSMPSSIGSLVSLRQLNFPNNRFKGEISISFENLSVLESLDLSSNQLSGTIPTHLTTLHSLSKLNLSYNHLTGRIPGGTQFQTFENDSYIGNDGLCRTPLSKICIGDKSYSPDLSQSPEQEDSDFIDGFSWRSVLIGYSVGAVFGMGIGCLIFFIGEPKWLIRFVEEEVYGIIKKRGRKNKMSRPVYPYAL